MTVENQLADWILWFNIIDIDRAQAMWPQLIDGSIGGRDLAQATRPNTRMKSR